jgi:hypothetical protein
MDTLAAYATGLVNQELLLQNEYLAAENHQGKNNLLLIPAEEDKRTRVRPPIRCKERLGGLLRYYHRRAA